MELYYLVIFGVILNSIGGGMYIKDTLLGKNKPNKVVWLIWALTPLIGTAATIYSQGFVWSVLPVFMSGMIPLLIFLASFVNKKSYWKLGKLDYFCLVLVSGALVLWGITDNPLLAIILSLVVELIVAVPLIKKIYQYPETETITPFFTGLISNALGLIVVKTWVMEEYLFPLYLVIICALIICTYYYSLNFRKK